MKPRRAWWWAGAPADLRRHPCGRCQAYRAVDLETPWLLAWELHDGTYELVARVRGEETYRAALPYPVEVRPAELAADE